MNAFSPRVLRGPVALVGRCVLIALIAVGVAGCRDSTGFVVEVDIQGTVFLDGTPFPAARVILRDQRTETEPGEVLALANANGAGEYALEARADRAGFGSSCGFLVLYVDGYRYTTELSTELRCSFPPQEIDLHVSETSAQVRPRPR